MRIPATVRNPFKLAAREPVLGFKPSGRQLLTREVSYSMAPPVSTRRLTRSRAATAAIIATTSLMLPVRSSPAQRVHSPPLRELAIPAISCRCCATMQQVWAGDAVYVDHFAKTESRLMRLIEGVEFIIVDKRAGGSALSARCIDSSRAATFDCVGWICRSPCAQA